MPMALHQSPGRQQQPPLQNASAVQGMPSPARGLPQFNGSFRPSFPSAANNVPYGAPLAGQKRDSTGLPNSPSSQSASDSGDGSYVKLFVGSVPRSISEDEVRPMFAEHGNVLEVALLKDKNTGQQQGCCFIKYATFEESERAIRYLHNQRTLPGGIAPVQVRYADGERERLGATEHKLFVGGLNRQASEKEIEEIFAPYGPVDDVYIMKDEMKQSRGCAFVKFPSRDMATTAMNGLNGTYIMRGCEHPLTVKHAVPKRTRIGDTRFGGPGFGGPGFNPRTGAGPYGPRPSFGPGGPMSGSRGPPLGWRPSVGGPGPGVGPRPQGGPGSYSMAPRGGPISNPSQPAGALGPLSGPAGGPAQVPFSVPAQVGGPGQKGGVGLMVGSTNLPQQYFQQTTQQTPQSFVQQSTLQPPQQQLPSGLQSQQQPQVFGQELSSLKSQPQQQLQQQQLQPSTMQPQMGSLSSHPPQQFQPIQSTLHQQSSLQPLQQQYAQLQPAPQQFTALQVPQQMQQQSLPLQQSQQQLQQPPLGVHSGAQQQPQLSLSSQTAYQQPLPQLQLQPQLQHQPQMHAQPQLQSQPQPQLQLQPQSQSQPQPQTQPQLQTQPQQQQFFHQVTPAQNPLQQQSWMGPSQAQPVSVSVPLPVAPSPTIATSCNWSEHTSPEGHKYYYNSVTGESKWEKPDEFTKFEQQQQQQAALPQPVSSVSYGAPATTPQYVSQGFTYGQTQLPNGSVNQFRQQTH